MELLGRKGELYVSKKCFGNTYFSYVPILSWGRNVNLCLTAGLVKTFEKQ